MRQTEHLSVVCLVSACARPATTRGLCFGHYRMACRYVADGRATGRDLEAEGKSLPPRRSGQRPTVAGQFFITRNPNPKRASSKKKAKP